MENLEQEIREILEEIEKQIESGEDREKIKIQKKKLDSLLEKYIEII